MNIGQYTADDLLYRRKSLRRTLSATEGLQPLKIAVLGGTTTQELVEVLEILLLASGFKPVFHQSEYGRYYEDAVVDPADLIAFAPDIVYVCTTYMNVRHAPPVHCSEDEFASYVAAETGRYRQIWDALKKHLTAQIIQNTFELPPYEVLGNLGTISGGGSSRFLLAVNAEFARAAATDPRLLLQDNQRQSAQLGLQQWFDWNRYFSYKVLLTTEANIAVARSLTSIVQAMYGRSKKVLVLDLDNTLWGGVIGDDGVEKIQIGRETPVAEAYTAFQEYCLSLQRRGILLAVCSKNNDEIARQGLEHPDSVLKLEHISSFQANWDPKHENIMKIAKELNLGADSFVFVDDNPAERAIVEAQISGIAVPDVGSDVAQYASIIEAGRYFEPVSMSQEDIARAALYQSNAQRTQMEATFADYGEYLDSLEMSAEIEPFNAMYIERISQLTNKTNQFNLTTRRYTLAEMEAAMRDSHTIGLYGKLSDRFGDNGLISIVLGREEDGVLHMDLWLMSCRVLKRDMEEAMLDTLVERARAKNVKQIRGYYLPTKKNGMVADMYGRLGFERTSEDAETGNTTWNLDVASYERRNKHIRILELVHG